MTIAAKLIGIACLILFFCVSITLPLTKGNL